jgi:hypothetical protein
MPGAAGRAIAFAQHSAPAGCSGPRAPQSAQARAALGAASAMLPSRKKRVAHLAGDRLCNPKGQAGSRAAKPGPPISPISCSRSSFSNDSQQVLIT